LNNKCQNCLKKDGVKKSEVVFRKVSFAVF